MLKGFKDFLLRGNIVDLAVAVVIGTAFTTLVGAFGSSFIDPLLGLVGGGGPEGMTVTVDGQNFLFGAFITALITFTITAAVVYFAIVVPMKTVQERLARGKEEAPVAVPEDIQLLREIRDALAAQRPGGPTQI
ncbi:large conductance mechanosensitive channel protein MscL [Aeromicrobium sp. CFBP 8757]|uniref:large conductance mechanosensitive channel protein MscL n=1 Tax=Aeromicrobium sp. CFBP 8757 TaxID=2775288 RepID=UPI001781B781|nr:large conductance mechanosensitive channel protein MscL [Aeromicrobium sp. CFBP 8757]MBD8606604.1 large conductance mechanosensitive channel protein MscL [Aeromicrobium sp. CFBP 8757]